MKPTRNIVKPNNGLWKTKGSVWYKKNNDFSDEDLLRAIPPTGKAKPINIRELQERLDDKSSWRVGIEWLRKENNRSIIG